MTHDLNARWASLIEMSDALATHVNAIDSLPEHLKVGLAAIKAMDPGDGDPSRESELRNAEALWTLVSNLWTQRIAVGERSHYLSLLDSVVSDAFAELWARSGVQRTDRWLMPLIWLEPMRSPVIFVRGKMGSGATLYNRSQRFIFPFPVILFPPDQLSLPWVWATSLHEVGHEIDEALGLSAELRSKLERLDPAANPADWDGWMRETVADFLAYSLIGETFNEVLEYVVGDHTAGSRSHPSVAQRTAALRDFFGDNAEPISEFLMNTELECLRGRTLSVFKLPRPEQSDRMFLLPKVVWEDRAELKSYDALKNLAISRKNCGAPVLPPAASHFLLEQVPALRPTLREQDHGVKIPPLELLRNAESVAFVGATNDGLPGLFRKYLQENDSKKLKHIEIYFLDERALSGLTHPEALHEDLKKLRASTIHGLPKLLNRVAHHWEIRSYTHPFFFGSFWDVDTENGRVHVSPHIWGQNVKYAPSTDYAAGDGYAYSRYVQGLQNLRRKEHSSAISSSNQSTGAPT